ncbi:MAG: regulatory protein RecX [Enterococcus sp.]|nr:regulatory protein RecX [Enterococcus sp.]
MAYGKKIKLWRTPDEEGEFKPLTDKELERLRSRAKNYCVWAMGNAPKTRKQLTDKMRQKNCPDEIIEETLKWMEDNLLLDDTELAENYVSIKQGMGKGKNKIAQDLRMKGIDPETIEQVLENTDEEAERERALEFVRKRMPSTRWLEKQKRVTRLVGQLTRNGYNMGIAFSVINEALAEEEVEEDED